MIITKHSQQTDNAKLGHLTLLHESTSLSQNF
jgi:hypothetical protein